MCSLKKETPSALLKSSSSVASEKKKERYHDRKYESGLKKVEDELEEGEIGRERQDEHRSDSVSSSRSHRRRRRSSKKKSLDREEKSPVKKVLCTETASVSNHSTNHNHDFKDVRHSGKRDTGIQKIEGTKSTLLNTEWNNNCFIDSDSDQKEYGTKKKTKSSPFKYKKELDFKKEFKELDVIDLTENDKGEVRNFSPLSTPCQQKRKEDHHQQQSKNKSEKQTSHDSKRWEERKKRSDRCGEEASSFPHVAKQNASGFQGYRSSHHAHQSMQPVCYSAFQEMCHVDPAIVSYGSVSMPVPAAAHKPCPIQSTISSLANQVIQQRYAPMYNYDPAIVSYGRLPLAASPVLSHQLPPANPWNSSSRFRWNAPSTASYSSKARCGSTAGSSNEAQGEKNKSRTRKRGIWTHYQKETRCSPQRLEQSCPEMEVTPRYWQVVQEHTDKQGTMEFTVMSYNVLAQDLLEQHQHLYHMCDAEDLEWDVRRRALTQQILTHNADILCLQEMQEDHWNSKFGKDLCSQGYSGHYIKRTGSKPDGCAILFKKDKFQLVKKRCVDFLQGGLLDRDNVGLILLLQPNRGLYKGGMKYICVATTHLLFNPKRGDVKLAQLMLLLAEIDKIAFRKPENEGVVAEADRNKKGDTEESASPSQLTAEQTNVGDIGVAKKQSPAAKDADFLEDKCTGKISPDSDMAAEGTALSTGQNIDANHSENKEVLSSDHYYPIIMCGDFNTEPECDLYNFITSGKLEYQGCVSRLLAGQKEGLNSWGNAVIPKNILPKKLGISERCQYIQEVRARQNKIHQKGSTSKMSTPLIKMNTGHAFHSHSFKSVYNSVLRKTTRGDQDIKAVSTQHMRASCIVDYIFYSSPSSLRQPQPDLIIKSEAGSQTLTNTEESLELIARYCLLSKQEVEGTGFMPNSVLPSDHLCLIAKFLLK